MSTDERPSPRAEIRGWLYRTYSSENSQAILDQNLRPKSVHQASSKTRQPMYPHDDPAATAEQRHKSVRRRHHRHSPGAYPPKRIVYETQSSRAHQRHIEGEAKPARLEARELGLGDEIHLQGPFRTFAREDNEPIIDSRRAGKERRRRWSTSSDLQPAATAILEKSPSLELHARKCHEQMKLACVESQRSSAAVSVASRPCNAKSSSPQRPLQTYERRQRHKTREDRYEVKKNKKRKRQAPEGSDGEKRPARKRKHKEKSGGALVHEFTAPNVSRDRLTLKPGKSLGLFGRGRASSPIRRRGLPDLAFSELAFLNTSRQKLEEPTKASSKEDTRKTNRAKKAAGTDAEISRYFTTSKPRMPGAGQDFDGTRRPEKQCHQRNHDSPAPFLDLPGKPFLGFGTSGAGSISPLKIVKELDARYIRRMSQRDSKSPSRSSSYLSWSESDELSYQKRQSDHVVTTKPRLDPHRRSVSKGHSVSRENEHSSCHPRVSELKQNDTATAPVAPLLAEDVPDSDARPSFRGVSTTNTHNPTTQSRLDGSAQSLRLSPHKSPAPNVATISAKSSPDVPMDQKFERVETGATNTDTIVNEPQVSTIPRPQKTAQQQMYHSLQPTLSTLLQACKAKALKALVEQGTEPAPQIVPERTQCGRLPHSDQATQPHKQFAPNQGRDAQPSVEPSPNDSQDVSRAPINSRPEYRGPLPASTIEHGFRGGSQSGQQSPQRPRTIDSTHSQPHFTQEIASVPREAWSGYDTLYERLRETGAGAANGDGPYTQELYDHRKERYDGEDLHHGQIDAERAHSIAAYAHIANDFDEFEPARSNFKDQIQQGPGDIPYPHDEIHHNSYQVTGYPPYRVNHGRPANYIQRAGGVPFHSTSQHEAFGQAMCPDTQIVGFYELETPRSSRRAYPGVRAQSFPAPTPPPTRSREYDIDSRRPPSQVREVDDATPVSFWRPNKLY